MTVRTLSDLLSRLSNTRHGNEAQDYRDLAESTYTGPVLLDSDELAGTQASITFSGIAADWRSLVIEGEAKTDRSGASTDGLAIRVGNGTVDSGTNYDFWYNRDGSGGSQDAISNNDTQIDSDANGAMINAANADTNKFAFARITIPFYASTDHERNVIVETWQVASGAGVNIVRVAGVWQNTAAAIDAVSLFPEIGSNFVAGTRFYLYGVHHF